MLPISFRSVVRSVLPPWEPPSTSYAKIAKPLLELGVRDHPALTFHIVEDTLEPGYEGFGLCACRLPLEGMTEYVPSELNLCRLFRPLELPRFC